MNCTCSAEYKFCIPEGTDYADAIGMLLRKSGSLGWRYLKHKTSRVTPHLVYGADSDWKFEAEQLAEAIGMSLEANRNGLYALVNPAEYEAEEAHERQLRMRFAWQMGRPDVDQLIDELPLGMWDEWKTFMESRHAA